MQYAICPTVHGGPIVGVRLPRFLLLHLDLDLDGLLLAPTRSIYKLFLLGLSFLALKKTGDPYLRKLL